MKDWLDIMTQVGAPKHLIGIIAEAVVVDGVIAEVQKVPEMKDVTPIKDVDYAQVEQKVAGLLEAPKEAEEAGYALHEIYAFKISNG